MSRSASLSSALCGMLLVVGSVYAKRPELQIGDLVGTYTYSGRFSGSEITIEPEGRFHIKSSDCTQEFYKSGTFTFKAGILSLVTAKQTVKQHGESDDQARDLLDPKVYEETHYRKPPPNDRKDELVPVKWGERLYLMYRESLPEFCHAINLGLEPRHQLGADWYLGSFYLRDGDEDKATAGLPSLPKDLLALLLETPVESTIESILIEDGFPIAIIDKGSEAGLKPGMRLVINEREFGDWPTLLSAVVVVSAKPNFAKLEVPSDAKVGDKVSSKFVDRRFQ